MCAIVGAILKDIHTSLAVERANHIMEYIWSMSEARGRDGRGYMIDAILPARNNIDVSCTRENNGEVFPSINRQHLQTVMIGNLRAEPTTEFVSDKRVSDQQPYRLDNWTIVHNGTIANDKDLRDYRLDTTIDSAAIAELLAYATPTLNGFKHAIMQLKGSYAIIASNAEYKDRLFVAANYRPVWYADTDVGIFFASARDYFPEGLNPRMLTPYTVALFNSSGIVAQETLRTEDNSNTALVVCSGGLDSVVSAVYAKSVLGKELHLIHFLYGSRAEGPEVQAIKAIAKHLDAKLTLFPLAIYDKSDSPLLNADSSMAAGEQGAEFAHEWVPARNLVMLSVASAFAEAKKITTIVLGNNMEEAGAYPDNEPEFIDKFNDILPFAVGDGKSLKVIMPVGNLMKHEIVKLGLELKAPMYLTWSCYNAHELHCGVCAPCYMRRKAFEINKAKEVIEYEETN